MKVVLDTNVLISAFVFPGGAPEQVYRLVLTGEITMVTSPHLLAELARVLTDKFGWESRYVSEVIAQLIRLAEIVEPSVLVSVVEWDPDDNRVLEAAADGQVDFIVSGDRDLLDLTIWKGIAIHDPATFLAKVW